MISLYLHIPFCRQKCSYCSFYSSTKYDIEEYTEAIIRCVAEFGEKTQDKVDTVYIGGGTPSVLPPKSICKLFAKLYDSFDIDTNAEITMEANPDSCDEHFLEAACKSGVNRISLGIQSFVDSELCAIGRIHSADQAESAVKRILDKGIKNISCDLIFGLPNQTAASFEYSLKKLIALEIGHISCYNLQVEPGTPLERSGIAVPNEDEQQKMYMLACEALEKAGYSHYEISNFAKSRQESIHNSSYWTGKDYLGLGPSAHSKIGNTRYSFSADTQKFINRRSFGFDNSERIEDILFEKIMLSLRTSMGLDLSLIPRSTKFIESLCKNGLAKICDQKLILTDSGFYLSNSIISKIAAIEC